MDAAGWDERYAGAERVWSVGPNQFVEEFCLGLAPRRAIDLAAGEGRNAIWLAEQGWDATAVDFSAAGLDRARRSAAERGVVITTEVADLTAYELPGERYDLVVIAYLHLAASQWHPILERAAAAVAPGGHLLIVGHDSSNIRHGYGGPQDVDVLNDVDDIVRVIGPHLAIERAEVVDRMVETDDGRRIAKDTLVAATRRTT